MRLAVVALALLVGSVDESKTLVIPFDSNPDVEAVRKIDGVRSAEWTSGSLTLKVDPYQRITLRQLEKTAGAKVTLDRFRIDGCVHVIHKGHGGGGGSGPCMERPNGGCFNAGPTTRSLQKIGAKAKLADIRPGGDIAWMVSGDFLASDLAKMHDFRDIVLSGVFEDNIPPVPSEYLPKLRPKSVKSASPGVKWVRTFKEAFARAKKEKKMILLTVHHFD